jgi:23S rRNA pseudouridine1911/1915/1917 synthase
MELLYQDNRIIVCIKPPQMRSTNEPGGLPEALKPYLTDCQATPRTVHRLDQVVGGVMVLAKSKVAAQLLSRQVENHTFQKRYLAVVQGELEQSDGRMEDLLGRDTQQKRTYVADAPGKDIRPASLRYRVLDTQAGYSLVAIALETGRTHQIRAQFSHRGYPLVGDVKYGGAKAEQLTGIALWSQSIAFRHPQTEEPVHFCARPPKCWPWNLFDDSLLDKEAAL